MTIKERTMKEFAEMLSDRSIGEEICKDEKRRAADLGLVVAYGYSDDNVELRGAIDEEVGAYDGTTIRLTKTGVLQGPACDSAENCECPYFAAAKNAAKTIEAMWGAGGVSWTFKTDIPHETFNIYEDGELFCVGIVFSMEDL